MKQADRRNLITTTAGPRPSGPAAPQPAGFYAVALAMALSIAACASFQETPAQRAQRIDPVLSAAGFQIVQANTPKKQSVFASLPPLTMNYYVAKDGQARYWFVDPYECNCVYQGDAKAYQRYQNLRIQQKLVKEEEQTAELVRDAAMQMNMYTTRCSFRIEPRRARMPAPLTECGAPTRSLLSRH